MTAIILDPTNAANHSRINGGRITGSMTGDLTVQESSGGGGGTAAFTIDTKSLGNITIPTVLSALTIWEVAAGSVDVGVLAGTLRVTNKVAGDITISTSVKPTGTIQIQGMIESTATIEIRTYPRTCLSSSIVHPRWRKPWNMVVDFSHRIHSLRKF